MSCVRRVVQEGATFVFGILAKKRLTRYLRWKSGNVNSEGGESRNKHKQIQPRRHLRLLTLVYIRNANRRLLKCVAQSPDGRKNGGMVNLIKSRPRQRRGTLSANMQKYFKSRPIPGCPAGATRPSFSHFLPRPLSSPYRIFVIYGPNAPFRKLKIHRSHVKCF